MVVGRWGVIPLPLRLLPPIRRRHPTMAVGLCHPTVACMAQEIKDRRLLWDPWASGTVVLPIPTVGKRRRRRQRRRPFRLTVIRTAVLVVRRTVPLATWTLRRTWVAAEAAEDLPTICRRPTGLPRRREVHLPRQCPMVMVEMATMATIRMPAEPVTAVPCMGIQPSKGGMGTDIPMEQHHHPPHLLLLQF